MLSYSAYDPEILKLIKRKQSYTAPVTQNELLDIMCGQISASLVRNINEAKFYSIMIDETTDVSNKEQMVLCLR